VARRNYPELPESADYYPALIRALKEIGGSATIEELEADVADLLQLSEAARAIPHGETNQTQFQYELAWVRTYLKWAGAVDNSERGVWHLTAEGREMSEQKLRGLWREIVAQRRKRSKPTPSAPNEIEPLATEPQDIEGIDPELTWKERLLDVLQSLDPQAFERLCQRLLRESGFIKVEVTGRSGDGGIDGVGVLRLNLLSFHVSFQCKKWKSSVGAPVVRDFRGAMIGRSDKGLILTTGTFTADARREATRDGAPAIDLVDGDALCDLLKELKLGVTTRFVEHIDVHEEGLRGI